MGTPMTETDMREDAKEMQGVAMAFRPNWLSLTQEEAIDPERPIIDPHHHLWDARSPLSHVMLRKLRY